MADDKRPKSGLSPYSSLPEYKLKADFPIFYENFKIEECLDWFYEVEAFFLFMDVPDSSKVKLVAYKHKGGAAAWWVQLCEDRTIYNRPPIRTWERMRKLIRAKFLPQDYKQQLFVKLQHRQQGAKSVEEYVSEFYSLVAKNQLHESEELVSQFIDGLNRLIQHEMTQSIYTRVEAIQQATNVERRVLRSPKAPLSRSTYRFLENLAPSFRIILIRHNAIKHQFTIPLSIILMIFYHLLFAITKSIPILHILKHRPATKHTHPSYSS